MKKYLYSTITLIMFALLLWSCASVQKFSRTDKTYYETKKQDENITVSYRLPVIKPTAKTTQSQTKGGVIISAEIVPFKAIRDVKQDKSVTYADATQPGYDNYEVSNIPYYTVTPENIQFKIRIRNNEQVPLKLSEVGFAIIIDGTQWSFPTGYLDDWNKGLILTGFEKEYTINGPQFEGLYSAQVVYLFLNGVPISYNEAGSVTKKNNFEWYFECKAETVQKDEQKKYTYETAPIYKEKCQKCSGTGTDPQPYKCSYCDGKGSITRKDKKTYKCSVCDGSGRVYIKCDNCGGVGVISLPKSTEAPVKSSITWSGWKVNVISNPPGAKVSMVDTKSGEYKSVGMSNVEANWYSSDAKSYPIIIEYQGQTVKVLPYNPSGEEIPKIVVDFLSGAPTVKEGKRVD
ncbi:MAG: hypothetical protein ABIG69_17460 [Bacteroidota bacterium]